MNKSASKYYHTALLMNQALIELLNKKDYDFITIKEICKKAGVNRSTFYLHYDNLGDLLCETIQNTNQNFLACFTKSTPQITTQAKEDLIFITPEYLLPYLNYIKENKVVYQVSAKHPSLMDSIKKYNLLKENILYPIFRQFKIPENQQKYVAAYYINGVYAIIDEWIKDGCQADINLIMQTIIDCVRPSWLEPGTSRSGRN